MNDPLFRHQYKFQVIDKAENLAVYLGMQIACILCHYSGAFLRQDSRPEPAPVLLCSA